MWWWPIRFYCQPQSPGLEIWGLGIGDWGQGLDNLFMIFFNIQGSNLRCLLTQFTTFGTREKGYKGIHIEYFPKNCWVFMGYLDL